MNAEQGQHNNKKSSREATTCVKFSQAVYLSTAQGTGGHDNGCGIDFT